MNERILQLAVQATFYVDPSANDGVCWNFDKEKFAQLIISECVSIAKSADDDTWKRDDKGTEIAKNIQQHFGVK